MRILVIEDNQDIAASIYDFFEELGHTMDAAADGVTGLHLSVTNDYDVIILDLGLPGIDGVDLCRRLRQDALKPTPVLMLTARDSLANKLEGFRAGADDYLVKPFALQELGARVEALAKRPATFTIAELKLADLVVNVEMHEVSRAGQRISLNPTIFRLLVFLLRNPHRVVTREELEVAVWNDNPPDSDALRTHLSNLRQAIDRPFDQPLLHTVRGFGYRLTDRVEED